MIESIDVETSRDIMSGARFDQLQLPSTQVSCSPSLSLLIMPT